MALERYNDTSMGWVADEGAALVPPPEKITIKFNFYYQTTHVFEPNKEEYNYFQREKSIRISLTELRAWDPIKATLRVQSPSMLKLKRVIDDEFDYPNRREVEDGILRHLRSPNLSEVPFNATFLVRYVYGLRIIHENCDTTAVEKVGEKRTTCSMCNEDVDASDPSRLPCRHLFHHVCIKQELGIENMCPVCQSEVPNEFLRWF